MKRKLGYLLSVMLIMSVIGYGIIKTWGNSHVLRENDDEIVIATSFYPMYILTLNLVDGIDGVSVVNLTENQTGCVHDYQLTTEDMRTIAGADVIVLNGGDMEEFMEKSIESYPNLYVITASEGIDFLEGLEHSHDHGEELGTTQDTHDHAAEEHNHEEEEDHDHTDESLTAEDDHDHDEAEHDHSAINGHVWMNMDLYKKQITTVATYLSEYDSKNASKYISNSVAYKDKITALEEKYADVKPLVEGKEIIIFHDAFAYLAQQLGMEVVQTIDTDSETALSAGEIAEVVEEIKLHSIQYLFTELQFSATIAERVAGETDANVYVMDSLVTGAIDKDAYLKGMEYNLKVLRESVQ